MTARPELVFVSPRFLFPADTGGAIRTSEILRGLRGGAFKVTLLFPANGDEHKRYVQQLAEIADDWAWWPATGKKGTFALRRLPLLASGLPVPIASDRSDEGRALVAAVLDRRPDVVVFDFLHSVVLAPDTVSVPSVLFTHNVEAEIFERHLQYARWPWSRIMWRNQLAKMRRFEGAAMRRFQRVIAVSSRDAARLERDYGRAAIDVIPTGVNIDYFQYGNASPEGAVVFTGSMDWVANIDAVSWFRDGIWPLVSTRRRGARMTVIGRNPPDHLVRSAPPDWSFTGRVDDIRLHMRGAAVFVIPMRIGGGTRIKAYEAMAMGVPVVSTSVGIEGLDVTPGKHFLLADSERDFAEAVVTLLTQPDLGRRLALEAHEHVRSRYSSQAVARVFENICERTMRAAARSTT